MATRVRTATNPTRAPNVEDHTTAMIVIRGGTRQQNLLCAAEITRHITKAASINIILSKATILTEPPQNV